MLEIAAEALTLERRPEHVLMHGRGVCNNISIKPQSMKACLGLKNALKWY
jgi:hypothetical protein